MNRYSVTDASASAAASSSSTPPLATANLGFPSIGLKRELKWATEAYWRGEKTITELHAVGSELRRRHWRLQADLEISQIPSNDFSWYDRMLDLCVAVGAVPKRFAAYVDTNDLDLTFAMARGVDGIAALEMTKWFDTNYHYVVPELAEHQKFTLRTNAATVAFHEARALGITTRPVLIGPLTFLLLARYDGAKVLDLLPSFLPVYHALLAELAAAGATWVQIDEPALAWDLDAAAHVAYREAYASLHEALPQLSIMLTTYFGDLRENLELACSLPIAGLHLDCVRAPHEIEAVATRLAPTTLLSCGVVDGRNIWRNNLEASIACIDKAVAIIGRERVLVAPSCSLLHVPIDLDSETQLDPDLFSWLAFGKEKLSELVAIASNDANAIIAARTAIDARNRSAKTHDRSITQRVATIRAEDFARPPYEERSAAQARILELPRFPTTTIGSLPQTPEVRSVRAAFRAGQLPRESYEADVRARTAEVIAWQEAAGLDVLVHGEFERTDMVEFFGEKLRGFATTTNAWVQSYGTRCVKPPIIFGDVTRVEPMTLALAAYAQSLTSKPVKGMLTGPITILQWSFVRDDQPRRTTAFQIALALRDEVVELEHAGIRIIQIDEPALREGLPLRKADHASYLQWSVDAFRLSAGGAAATTQIHTHMCYAEFDHIIEAIAALDADVISIETARSAKAIFATLARFTFPYMIGPGVYDIHSPNVPTAAEIKALIENAEQVVPATQLWINPDCGLKTRRWEEVRPAVDAMVQAARELRAEAMLHSS